MIPEEFRHQTYTHPAPVFRGFGVSGGKVLNMACGESMRIVVEKRDGSKVEFDSDRIDRAVTLALGAVGKADDYEGIRAIRLHALSTLMYVSPESNISVQEERLFRVEQIQDQVERSLMAHGEFEAAKAFILYRNEKATLRPKEYGDSGISDYIIMSKYARYRADLGRREVWSEAVERVFDMHRDFFSTKLKRPIPHMGITVGQAIDRAQASVSAKQTLPSMRSLQFGGQAVLESNCRIFNCSFGHINHPRRFAEATWLLLNGVGVGFSVQRHHVAQLPPFPAPNSVCHGVMFHPEIILVTSYWERR